MKSSQWSHHVGWLSWMGMKVCPCSDVGIVQGE